MPQSWCGQGRGQADRVRWGRRWMEGRRGREGKRKEMEKERKEVVPWQTGSLTVLSLRSSPNHKCDPVFFFTPLAKGIVDACLCSSTCQSNQSKRILAGDWKGSLVYTDSEWGPRNKSPSDTGKGGNVTEMRDMATPNGNLQQIPTRSCWAQLRCILLSHSDQPSWLQRRNGDAYLELMLANLPSIHSWLHN